MLATYIKLWCSVPANAPQPGRVFTPNEQAERESQVNRESEALKAMLRRFPKNREAREPWRTRLLDQAKTMAGGPFGLNQRGLNLFFTAAGLEATQQFVREARRFDPQMSEASLHQALRNLWVMQSIQLLLQRPVTLTPTVFAYSMLYPLTDNYLDNPDISPHAKGHFCEWLGDRLRGKRSPKPHRRAAQVGQLIAQIEATFPRAEFEEVYLALQAIHEAQLASLEQQRSGLSGGDLLQLTIRKGGASVLADAYLVRGQLTEAEAHFMFGYGVLLQFMDDLQDFKEDLAAGHATLFARQAAEGSLDELSSMFLQFSQLVLAPPIGFETAVLEPVTALLRDNCLLLLLQTVARNPHCYTPGFVRKMECCSPFSFSYLATRETTLHQEYSALASQLQRRRRIESALDFLV